MAFEYVSSKGKTEIINIIIGNKWSQLKTADSFLNTIFSKIDNGDGIVQEQEYMLLNTLLSLADKAENADNKLSFNELKNLAEKINTKELNIEDVKLQSIVQIDPNKYSPEQLKKRYPESKYKIKEKNNSFEITDKNTNKKILTINRDKNGFYISDYDENEKEISFRNYNNNGTLFFYDTYRNGTNNRHYPIAELINSDICAKSRFHLWTTGNELEKHIMMLDKNNIVTIMEEYKKQYGEDIVDAIKGEYGLDKNIKNRVLNHIKKCLEDNYGYKRNFVNKNSQVSNKWHKGDSYSIVNKNDILIVKNTKTGKTRTIDLNKLTENLDLRGQAAVKAQLTQLPGEILMDVAIETSKLKQANWIDKLAMHDGIAAYYNAISNNITLGFSKDYDISKPLIHELGHAVDFKGKFINSSTVSEYNKFVETFKKEKEIFLAKGGKQHDWNDKGAFDNTYIRESGGINISNYATENERECFAEIYQLLTTGECNSVDMLEDFFHETIKLAEQILDKIRNLPDDIRN